MSEIQTADWASTDANHAKAMRVPRSGLPARREAGSKEDVALWSPIKIDYGATRNAGNVQHVTAFVADLDKVSVEQVDGLLERLAVEGVEHWAHTTYRHTSEKPRWRVVLPLDTPVMGRDWKRVWRALKNKYAPWMDRSCCDPSRAYYHPSHPPGAEWEQYEVPGSRIDWTHLDLSDEPEDTRGQALAKDTRILTVEELTELSDTIADNFPELGSRHELALAIGGALRRELVREEQIENLVAISFEAGGSTCPEKHGRTARQSAEAAAKGDPTYGWSTVREILGTNELRQQGAALKVGIQPEVERVRNVVSQAKTEAAGQLWVSDTSRDITPLIQKNGAPVICCANIEQVLLHHPAWSDVLAFNELSQAPTALKDIRVEHAAPRKGPWTDDHTTAARIWFVQMLGIEPSEDMLYKTMLKASKAKSFNPIQDYLTGVQWDGKRRLNTWLIDYLGVRDSTYARAVGKRWLISAVARAMQPGVKVDCMLILEGVQGAKKSSALEALCHDRSWFCNSPIDMRSKEGAVTLLGKWIIEIQELDAMRRAEATKTKEFMTIRTDTYRPPYGRSPRDIHRSCVFSGTTNETAFLTDTTGNRRYWPVYCHSIDIPGLVAARDQLWGEAFEEWASGERHWLEGHEVRLAAEVAADKMIEDPRGETIQEWADSKPDGFTMAEVMRRLEIAPERQAAAAKTVGQLLKKLGYESTRKASKAGKIRLYTKSQSQLPHAVHAVPDAVGPKEAGRSRVPGNRASAPGFGSS